MTKALFEAAASRFPNRLPLEVGCDGQYLDSRTNVAWLIWQEAARANPPAAPSAEQGEADAYRLQFAIAQGWHDAGLYETRDAAEADGRRRYQSETRVVPLFATQPAAPVGQEFSAVVTRRLNNCEFVAEVELGSVPAVGTMLAAAPKTGGANG